MVFTIVELDAEFGQYFSRPHVPGHLNLRGHVVVDWVKILVCYNTTKANCHQIVETPKEATAVNARSHLWR